MAAGGGERGGEVDKPRQGGYNLSRLDRIVTRLESLRREIDLLPDRAQITIHLSGRDVKVEARVFFD